MPHWISDHRVLLTWLTAASLILFVATLFLVPFLIVRIPADYFAHTHRPPSRWARRHAVIRIAILIAKNILGWVFIAAGIAMLVLPGQGLLTLLLGLLLVDYPGKYRFERWLISRRRILNAINWFRHRRGRAPLTVAPEHA